MHALKELGIVTRNGKTFKSGNLYYILKGKIYIGKIEHKGQVYEGILNQVQELLKKTNQSHERKYKAE